jgi:hypothetical protein
MENEQRYFSYLLRLWLAGDEGQLHWRASLEDPHSGERIGFDHLELLYQFLNQQTSLQNEKRPARKDS